MKERIGVLAEEIISGDPNIFLVDIVLKGHPGSQKLLVLIDGDEGLSIDQCAQISRLLGKKIEEEDLIEGKYTLEVSSPGLDMPITLFRQYRKNIGRNLKIELKNGEKISGKLLKADESKIELEPTGKKIPMEIKIEEINRTFVEVSFK